MVRGYDISWRVEQEVNFLRLFSSRHWHGYLPGMLNSSSKPFPLGSEGS